MSKPNITLVPVDGKKGAYTLKINGLVPCYIALGSPNAGKPVVVYDSKKGPASDRLDEFARKAGLIEGRRGKWHLAKPKGGVVVEKPVMDPKAVKAAQKAIRDDKAAYHKSQYEKFAANS